MSDKDDFDANVECNGCYESEFKYKGILKDTVDKRKETSKLDIKYRKWYRVYVILEIVTYGVPTSFITLVILAIYDKIPKINVELHDGVFMLAFVLWVIIAKSMQVLGKCLCSLHEKIQEHVR